MLKKVIFKFLKLHSIEEVSVYEKIDVKKMRNDTKILVIDDEDFKPRKTLEYQGYRIDKISDLESFTIISSYDLVICDIKGVGKKLESEYEGAHLIGEINKQFPYKPIIAYSGHSFDIKYNKFFNVCDEVLQKDTLPDVWSEKIDECLSYSINPKYRWKKIRQKMIDTNIRLDIIIKLEDQYVESILNSKDIKFDNALLNMLPALMRTILLQLAAKKIIGILP
ncbi:MAG: response regulator [Desulfomicrobium sp.]|nr:response regulator [Desulfomicrobium sp.]